MYERSKNDDILYKEKLRERFSGKKGHPRSQDSCLADNWPQGST